MNLSLPNQYDFLPRFFKLAIANVLSNLLVPLSGLISIAFLGHLSEIHHLVGVALATILFNCLYIVLSFLRMSTTGVTAQAVGQDDREAIILTALRNGLIALGLGLLILVLQYPLRELGFALLSGTPEAKASGFDYFNARIWGAPAVLLNFVLIGWFLGREESGKVLLMSLIGNAANVVLDYIFIVQWNWASAGAGLSQAVSQYLMLFVGLIFACLQIQWKEITAVARQVVHKSAVKSTFTLNGNLFVSTIVIVACFNIFQDLSSTMGTILFTENTLMMQIVLLSIYLIQGLGFATETLSGNFKGKGANEQLIPLIQIAGVTSLLVGFTIALVSVFFPETVFGLLTNHSEVTEQMDSYVQWLLPILGFLSVAAMLDGYFLGLADGHTVRNVTLASVGVGFVPAAVAALHFHSNHLLWTALSAFLATRAIIYGIQLPKTFKSDVEESTISPVAVEEEIQVQALK
jgi:MATE family multidrug resistance protein